MDLSLSSKESSESSSESSSSGVDDEEFMLAVMLVDVCIDNMKEQAVADTVNEICPSSKSSLSRNKKKKYDYDCAKKCIYDDFIGPEPLFSDGEFCRMFRITKSHFETIRLELGNNNPFFTQTYNCVGEPGPDPTCKILAALKQLAFAEVPYFQMSENTVRDCVKEFAKTLVYKGNLRLEFLRAMTSHDAENVRKLHLQLYGVDGIIGGLDCTHMHWDKCPTGLQGQFKGKEGKPTIVLEGMADYNLWIWHAQVGYPGTLNDINILQTSALIDRLLSNEWCMTVNQKFSIGGEEFDHYLILVDGIYPLLDRFVKTISHPTSPQEAYFAKWQELFRKLIERAFGVFFLKFQYLDQRIRLYDLNMIGDITLVCVLLHNMMVKERMQNGSVDSDNFYYVDKNAIEECRQTKFNIDAAITHAVPDAGNMDIDLTDNRNELNTLLKEYTKEIMNTRWKHLNDSMEHGRLQRAIVRELQIQKEKNPRFILDNV